VIGEASDMYGNRRAACRFGWRDQTETDNLEDLSVDGRIILKITFQKLVMGMACIYLAYDRRRCRGLVNAVMNLDVPYKVANFMIS